MKSREESGQEHPRVLRLVNHRDQPRFQNTPPKVTSHEAITDEGSFPTFALWLTRLLAYRDSGLCGSVDFQFPQSGNHR